jgi:hypothetical protein
MIELMPDLKCHFDRLQDRFRCFAELGIQCEGWFKGELLTQLLRMREAGLVQGVDREVPLSTSKVDLSLRLRGEHHWIELKHWLIGVQKGTTYGPGFYFLDRTSIGIVKDVDKLHGVQETRHRWLLLLLSANPGEQKWEAGVAGFNAKFAPRRLISRTSPSQFPPSYFLGLLEVEALSVAPTFR